jgi:hypothetical protein
VVVRRDGSPCLLDLDSMPAPANSRWYDLSVFLVNLESQIKYAPLCDAAAVARAWRSFWSGYAGARIPDGLSVDQARALLFLVKFEYVFQGTWLSVFDVYTDRLATRYLRRLKASLVAGEHFALGPST